MYVCTSIIDIRRAPSGKKLVLSQPRFISAYETVGNEGTRHFQETHGQLACDGNERRVEAVGN